VTKLIVLFVFSWSLNGCGNSSETPKSIEPTPSSSTITENVAETIKTKGYLLFNSTTPIEGMTYVCSDGVEGITDKNGMFECDKLSSEVPTLNKTDKPITFKLGNLKIASLSIIPTDTNVYLQNLLHLDRDNYEDIALIKLTKLIYSLRDSEIEDRVVIPQNISDEFSEEMNFIDMSEEEIETLVTEVGKKVSDECEALSSLGSQTSCSENEENNVVVPTRVNPAPVNPVPSVPVVVPLSVPNIEDVPSQTYTKDSAITTLVFSNTGGAITSCRVSPTLPIGLSVGVNNDTCEITGTPTVVTAEATYTVTGSNALEVSDTASVEITVNPIPIADPNIENATSQTYTKDSAITTLVFSNTGGAITSCRVSPTLPIGLSVGVNNDTCEITGTPTVVTAQATYTVTGSNALEVSDTASVEITVIENGVLNTFSADDYEVFFIDKSSDDFNYTLELGSSSKDVYLLFTNPESTAADIAPTVVRKNIANPSVGSASVASMRRASVQTTSEPIEDFVNIIPKEIREFNENPPTLIKKSEVTLSQKALPAAQEPLFSDAVADTQTFDAGGYEVNATCKKVVTANSKTLNIWVADDSFGVDCAKKKCVTQAMVDIAADKFLKAGDNNDIYEYVTNILGDEWGPTQYNNLVDDNNEITILFLDINNDNSNSGGTIGYFTSKDNFLKRTYSSSNERIMFYMDSVMYASESGSTWDIDDYWPSFVISTLTHEFQHMIQFYQKGIKHGAYASTWFNEMCSMITEDMLADKINVAGPRGVTPSNGTAGDTGNGLGRLPRFNQKNYRSLLAWNNDFPDVLYDYSTAYSFGGNSTVERDGAKQG